MPPELSPGLSIVVPIYCGKQTLSTLANRIEKVLASGHMAFELLLVNDCSPDDSWKGIQDLAAEKPWIRGIHLMRNYGQHNALLAGVRQARFDRIVTLDDDLQHPPEAIPLLLAKLDEGFDVVYAPPLGEKHGALRNFSSVATKTLLKYVLGVAVARNVASFRAFRTELRNAFADYHSPTVFLDVLLTWATSSFASVPVRHEERACGTSGYTFWKLVLHSINMVTSFSTLPLRFAGLMGSIAILFGICLLALILLMWLLGGIPVRGFTMLATMLIIFSGVQLMSLGILGEYLARMYLRSMGRPPYVIKSTTSVPGPTR
ncbi:MAG: glycosyltransferase family 2 protein [Verrucomicrobiota bacterium]|jgi:undecaprenyl-phosphate 4-deoxy-4-formamido-L-arabinose transferase|nr:glycosyltransferase family 2 protein [Verrucomicrobiota bacterium]